MVPPVVNFRKLAGTPTPLLGGPVVRPVFANCALESEFG